MEEDGQFKVPNNDKDAEGTNPPAQGERGSYQEATPKVDNFSPPKEETFKTPSNNEEVEDVFDNPSSQPQSPVSPAASQGEPTPAPTPTPVSVEKPTPPKDNRGEPISFSAKQNEKQKFDLPEEKKGHGCLWAIIILIIIFLLIGGAIFVNEWGVLNLGIEKYYGAIHLERLWGGLPKESKAALGISIIKMKDKSFNLEGSDKAVLAIEAGEASPSPTATSSPAATPTVSPDDESDILGVETTAAKDTISKITSEGLDLEGEIKINGKIQNKDKIEVILSTKVESQETAITDLLGKDTMVDLTFIYDNSDIYLKDTVLKRILSLDKDWLKIINDPKTAETASTSKIGDLISGGERIGSEKVNGVSCYIYEVKINSSAFAGLANNFVNLGWFGQDASFATAKFYLGKKDHYIHKAEINLAHNPDKIILKSKITLNFNNIGSNIQIAVPAADEAVEKNWSEVKSAFITGATVPAQGTPEERDQKRKADLKTIQDALLAYKVQNSNYPSTSGIIEKTRDSTSSLKTALVPDFLDSLPLDPENEKYYYGYKSNDGTECELSSILEVKTDPDGEQIGDYWIYKLEGN